MEQQRLVLTNPMELSPVVQACLNNGSEVILIVTGNSMRPMLRHGRDQVILKQCDPHRLQVGDLPLYRRASGQIVLHRVVGLGASTYTMCGDAQAQKEYGVPCSAVLAVVSGFYRRGKQVSCDSFSYRVYVRCWLALRPLRPFLLRCVDFMLRVGRKLRRMCHIKAGKS